MTELEENLLRNIVVLRCLREWINAETAKGIIVDTYEAIEMNKLMETVIRTYQEEVKVRSTVAYASAAAAASSR